MSAVPQAHALSPESAPHFPYSIGGAFQDPLRRGDPGLGGDGAAMMAVRAARDCPGGVGREFRSAVGAGSGSAAPGTLSVITAAGRPATTTPA